MADAPVPKTSSSYGAFFGGTKRIPTLSFYGYLFSAIVVDIVLSDWLPGSGTAFVLACRGMYMINGYKTDKMTTTTVATALIGIIPILADVTNIVFVVSTYLTNVAETKEVNDNKTGTGQSLTARAAQYGSSYIAARSIGAGLKGFGGVPANEGPGTAGPQNAGYEEKNPRSSVASAPLSNADKNIGYAQRGNVDGVNRQSRPDTIGYRNDGAPAPTDIKNTGDQNAGYSEAA